MKEDRIEKRFEVNFDSRACLGLAKPSSNFVFMVKFLI